MLARTGRVVTAKEGEGNVQLLDHGEQGHCPSLHTHLAVVTAEEGEGNVQLVDHGDEQHGVADTEGAVRDAVHTHYHAADLRSRGL